ETVMFRGPHLSEAAASNVWVVKNGVVLGPQKNHLVLEGIRYDLLAELCDACGLGYALRDIERSEVQQADELLLTSATKEVLAITTLDGILVGHPSHRGKPGPVCARLYAAYQDAKKKLT
ncbi:MAG: aminotransferase class IV, partial [Rhodospirillaceae bacterium]